MRVAVVRETLDGERRVAVVPDTVAALKTAGCVVAVQAGAGRAAYVGDDELAARGAEIGVDRAALLRSADVVLAVQPLPVGDVAQLAAGAVTISFLQPWLHGDTVRALAASSVTSFSLDLVPRLSRAQSMDALSSQALVAGYRAVMLAATAAPRMFPLFMTAAGTVAPAKVLVLGAGVAGLQAIATARRLGAVVTAYDVRAASADEVRSLGAAFLELELDSQEGEGGYARAQSEDFLERQRELLAAHVARADVVIAAAAVPGRPAPLLITTEAVAAMRPGSVIVDLGAGMSGPDASGNCAVTVPGESVDVHGVRVIGPRNPAAAHPLHASALFARNAAAMLGLLIRDGRLDPDWDDEILQASCVTRAGEVMQP